MGEAFKGHSPSSLPAPGHTASQSSSDNSSPALVVASALPPMALAAYGLASSLRGGGSGSFVLRHGLSFGILRTKDAVRSFETVRFLDGWESEKTAMPETDFPFLWGREEPRP